MQRKTLVTSALILLVAVGGGYAIAQDVAPKNPPAPATKAPPAGKSVLAFRDGPDPMAGPGFGHPGFGDPGFGRDVDDPGSPVIDDLLALERLYRESGRSKELTSLYNEVLAKSQDPRVRNYAYHHLARLQATPANTDQAIATLRKSLDEDLANEARHRAELDKMRSEWEQRHNATPTPAQP